ncbi:MAG: RHS repeat-associated core domain-containing protein [Armatimonadota bacterium]
MNLQPRVPHTVSPKETDARGNATQFTYDAANRQTQIDMPGGNQILLAYWEPGMLKSKTNKEGTTETTVDFEYDGFNRLTKRAVSGTDTEFEYYKNDLRKTMKDASGEKRYYYDMAQRLTKVEQGPQGFVIGTDHNYVLEYVWNAASQVTQKKVTLRGLSAKTWDYTYTDDGQLARVTNPDGEVTDHDYLSDGRLKKITLRATDLTGKTTREVFYQDTSNTHDYVSGKMPYLRRTLDKKESGTVITDFEYELDKAGIRLSMKDKDGKYWAFTYDPRYQLRSETKWSAKTGGSRSYQYAWLYDPNGNRLTQHDDGVPTDYVYGANNQMTDAGAVDFTYDHFGNTKTKVEGGNTTTYNWDDEGHLTGVDFPGTTNDDEHQYDGDGKRMRSKLNGASDWTNFVHDELTGEILMEYTLVGGTFTIKAVNTWGLGLISTNREGTKRYFHFDALGSTRALTDSSETVTDTYEYNAFGVVESSSGTSVNPYRYVGQYGYYDDGAMGSSSGLLLLGVRYYSPAHGRFWSWDPVPNLNLYGYVGNSATMAIDPRGDQAWKRVRDALIIPGPTCLALILIFGWNEDTCRYCCSVAWVIVGTVVGRTIGAIVGGILAHMSCQGMCYCEFHRDDPDCTVARLGGTYPWPKDLPQCCCNCGMEMADPFPCPCDKPPLGCRVVPRKPPCIGIGTGEIQK